MELNVYSQTGWVCAWDSVSRAEFLAALLRASAKDKEQKYIKCRLWLKKLLVTVQGKKTV